MQASQFLKHFTAHLKHAIARGIAIAAAMHHGEVTTLHLLLALAEERGSLAADLLGRRAVTPDMLRDAVSAQTWNRDLPKAARGRATLPMPVLHEEAKEALERGMMAAYDHVQTAVGTEHLLLGILSADRGLACDFLAAAQSDKGACRKDAETLVDQANKLPQIDDVHHVMEDLQDLADHLAHDSGEPHTAAADPAKQARPHRHRPMTAIEAFTIDLTGRAAQKRIDPVIGRSEEIARLIHILCRRTKNNPILVGEPGVGKTAIVEGLARRIATGEVPGVLRGKKILSLDLPLLLAGSIYRGEFEARLKQLTEEVAARSDAILFIDEAHNLIGAGAPSGAMDAANIVKPALARGELRCIGATTEDEYERYIVSDPALERRFQKIIVDEPTPGQAEQILHGVAPQYEKYHHVRIAPEAIAAAVAYSVRYLHEHMLPDKAIDLLDEAAAAVRAGQKSARGSAARDRLVEHIRRAEDQKQTAMDNNNVPAAARAKTNVLSLRRKLTQWDKQHAADQPTLSIGPDHVAAVIAQRLRMPVADIVRDEWTRLHTLRDALKQRVVGQDAAIHDLVSLLERAHLRRKDDPRPIASFLFTGPPGVGKTALSRALADALYRDQRALIKFDMSEFSEPHSISKLLGSPAGYVGHRERNRFTDDIKKRPYAVVLFDEFDKAHADVQRLLLQILDDGELTDSHGKKLHFRHTIIILTTNIGSEYYANGVLGFGAIRGEAHIGQDAVQGVYSRLKETFGGELLDRIHGAILFAPLSPATIEALVAKELADISETLRASQSFTIVPDGGAVRALADACAGRTIGARQIARTVERLVADAVMETLGNARRKKTYTLTHEGSAYRLR